MSNIERGEKVPFCHWKMTILQSLSNARVAVTYDYASPLSTELSLQTNFQPNHQLCSLHLFQLRPQLDGLAEHGRWPPVIPVWHFEEWIEIWRLKNKCSILWAAKSEIEMPSPPQHCHCPSLAPVAVMVAVVPSLAPGCSTGNSSCIPSPFPRGMSPL